MMKEFIIYVTLPGALCASEWQSAFLSKMKLAISKTVKVNCRYIIKNADDDLQSVLQNIEAADVFITVLDTIENSNNEYLNELYAISDLLLKKKQDDLALPIYKINLAPDNLIQQPELFQSLRSYSFYEIANRRNVPHRLEFSKQNQSNKAWNLILDLSFDLRGILKNVSTATEVENSNRKYIYLGTCSDDLVVYRDEIKREYQHYGYTVLPLSETNSPLLIDDLAESLERCELVLQFMGASYGKIEKGERVSLIEKENISINEYVSSTATIERLVWVPEFLKRIEHRQTLFLNRIKQKESSSNTQVLESSFDVLKDALLQKLKKDNGASGIEDAKASVYYISKENTVNSILSSMFEEQKINVRTINYNQPAELIKQHIELLKTTDNVLINWESEDKQWLRSKLSDLVKAPGMGRKRPFETITIVYGNSKPDISGFENFLRGVKVLQISDKEGVSNQFRSITE